MKANVRHRKSEARNQGRHGMFPAAVPPQEDYLTPLRIKRTPNREKIVVVDKERTLANSVVNILQRHGYCALPAFSGEDAVHLARHFVPHCVLAEFFMPDTNGIELLTAVYEAAPQCKFLFASYDTRAADLVDRARSKGFCCEFLAKPLAEGELLRRLSAQFEEEEPASQPSPGITMFAKAGAV
jgi:DNA-binding response OmpR family regulator